MIKAHVLNRFADAAESFVQVMVDNRVGLKEFESATFGMLLGCGRDRPFGRPAAQIRRCRVTVSGS